jgi:hypothetical protein
MQPDDPVLAWRFLKRTSYKAREIMRTVRRRLCPLCSAQFTKVQLRSVYVLVRDGELIGRAVLSGLRTAWECQLVGPGGIGFADSFVLVLVPGVPQIVC